MIAEKSRMMKMALRMRTRVMFEAEACPGYLRSSLWQQGIRSYSEELLSDPFSRNFVKRIL